MLEERLERAAARLIDRVALGGPRLLGVGAWLYLLPLIGLILGFISAHLVGDLVFPRDLGYELVGPTLFTLGVALIGSAIAPEMIYVDERKNVRLLEHRVGQVLQELIRNHSGALRVPGRAYTYAVLLTNMLIVIWLLLKPLDTAFMKSYQLARLGDPKGYLGLAANLAGTAAFIVFWNVVAIAVMHFLWVHHHALRELSNALRKEVRGQDVLRLNEVLVESILSSKRPALAFLHFRSRIMGLTSALNKAMKRLLILSVFIIATSVPLDLRLRGQITYGAVSASIIGVGLAIPVAWALYTITKWSRELQTLILIELRNIRIQAYSRHDETTLKAAEELEYLSRELGHTLIQSRELWELIAALITLIATVLGLIAGLQQPPA